MNYRTSIHNEGTAYDYDLLLKAIFNDLGIAQDTTEPLVKKMDSLRNSRGKESRKILQQILEIQSDIFVNEAKKNPQWAFEVIKNWSIKQWTEKVLTGELSGATVRGYLRPIKILCDQNDILINWKKIQTKFGKAPRTGKDKAYSAEQIRQLITYPDRRIKPIALTMASSGCRVGAFDYLNLGDIFPIYQNKDGSFEEQGTLAAPLVDSKKLVASRVLIYRGEIEEYPDFITPECTRAIAEYVEFRRESGEKIKNESPVIRDLFTPDKGARGEPHLPRRFAQSSLKNLMQDAIIGTGLRPAKLPKGKHRWDFQMDHGLRKFFETVCDDHDANFVHSEKLMGHSGKLGLKFNYNRSETKALLATYLKVVPHLTITNEEKFRAEKDIIKEEQKRTCPRCTMVCPPEAEICNRCGTGLTLQAVMKQEESLRRKEKEFDDLKLAFKLKHQFEIEADPAKKHELGERLNELMSE